MQILRMPMVKARAGYSSNTSVYDAIRDGLWTSGVAIGRRSKGWPDYEISSLIAARIAGKSHEEIRALVKSLHAKRTELVPLVDTAAELGSPSHASERRDHAALA